MASTLHEDIGAFLDDAVTTLTNLHVKAAQYAGEPAVQAAFDDLASVPGALIEQAQQLRARLDDESYAAEHQRLRREMDSEVKAAKPKAKPAAVKH